MAVKNPTVSQPAKGVINLKWVLANGDTGAWFSCQQNTDRSVHAFGTFGAGGSVQVEGSNDPAGTNAANPTNSFILHDVTQTTTAVFTSAGAKQLLEATAWIRPNCTAGDGTTALTVEMTIIARRM